MAAFIITGLVGVLCIVIGILNTKGNISMLHSYHRHRVTEEDRIPFGKKIGLGMIIVGASIIAESAFSVATLYTDNKAFLTIGNVILISGIVIGLAIIFHAMVKYNKGIF